MTTATKPGKRPLQALPRDLTRELSRVGNRAGHYRAFRSLVRNWPSWEAVRREYAGIERPVVLVYGEHDWRRRTSSPER